ncbi:MAG: serine hydrolase [Vicingaceae bacterium]
MKKFFSIALAFMLMGCLKEEPLKKEYTSFQPPDIGDGWQVGSCKNNLVDSVALDNIYQLLYQDDDQWTVKSMLVFRNGELLAESYLKDEIDRTRPQAVWSCTKQVMGLLSGILIDQNELYLTNILEQFLRTYTDRHKEKAGITIKQLLSMKSGIAYYNDEHTDFLREKRESNSVEFILELPMEHPPGSHFLYKDGDPQLLSAVMQEVTGLNTDVLAQRALFSKIGMTNYAWYRYQDNVTLGAFGLMTTPRELAKIGQLVLDSGAKDGNQLISEAWIAEMLTPRNKLAGAENIYFGYYWWRNVQKNYSFMWGHGGQFVFLIPDKNAMVVFTGLEQVEGGPELKVEEATSYVDRIAATMQ